MKLRIKAEAIPAVGAILFVGLFSVLMALFAALALINPRSEKTCSEQSVAVQDKRPSA